jgi:hypothetical protein
MKPPLYLSMIRGRIIIKKRGNDIIQERVEQGNSDSSIIVSTVQFYNKNYNSQSNH